MALWRSGYNYCTTSFNKALNQVMCRFKSCLRHVRDLQWWGSLAVVHVGNEAKWLSQVNHTTKIIHHQFINSPLEIFELLFNHEIKSCIITETKWCASVAHNDSACTINEDDICKFVGVIFLSGQRLYHNNNFIRIEEMMQTPLLSIKQ